MAFAQGSRSRLSFITESVWGTTPPTPNLTELPINGHSLNLVKETLESGEIRSDRQTSVSRHGNSNVAGDIEVEFRPAAFDDLLESALFSTFNTAGVMEVATTEKSLTIEDAMLDAGQYRVFTGCEVGSMSMNLAPNQMVTATFSMFGKGSTISSSPLDASVSAAPDKQPFDTFSGTITEGGGGITIVSGLNFTLNNNINPAFVIGQSDTKFLESGRAIITGTLQAYFEDASLYNKFLNEVESSLVFTLPSSVTGDSCQFNFPRVKYNTADIPLASEQSRILSLDFQSIRDGVSGTNLIITKS